MKNKIDIVFEDKTLSFFFGLSFLGDFLENQSIELSDIDEKLQKNPFKFIPLLMYESYKHASKRIGNNNILDYYKFTDVLESVGGLGALQVQQFIQAFTESLTKNVPEVEADNDAKKK